MKTPMFTSFLAATAIATSAAFPPSNAGAKSLSTSELSSLRAQSRSEFETLRAGKIERQAPVSAAERARLQQAQAQSPKLDALRGGDITNDDLRTILIIAGVIVIVALLI